MQKPKLDLNVRNSVLARLGTELQFEESETILHKPITPVVLSDDEESDLEDGTQAESRKLTKKSSKSDKPASALNQAVDTINSKLNNLHGWYDLLTKDVIGLNKILIGFEDMTKDALLQQKTIVQNKTELVDSTANALMNECSAFMKVNLTQLKKLTSILQEELEQRGQLQDIVEQLAKHQDTLMQKAAEQHLIRLPTDPSIPTSTEDEAGDEHFFDASDIVWSNFIVPPRRVIADEGRYIARVQKHYVADTSTQATQTHFGLGSLTTIAEQLEFPAQAVIEKAPVKVRRTIIPEKPNLPLNLWTFLKNCVGKDLAHVPMPVNFNEPLSMLQRLTECFEYSNLLDIAADCEDECKQLAYVAAFSVSNYAYTGERISKPFNPLLGETYECDRTNDLGWRSIAEQVSHHPPISAIFCEGRKWVCWQEFNMRTKFRVKYLQVDPAGNTYVEFKNTGHKYMWRKVTTTIYNIVIGKLWVDQEGTCEIVGFKAAEGLKCLLDYIPYSYFSKEQQRCVKGIIINREGKVPMLLRGSWDREIGILPVISVTGKGRNVNYETGEYTVIWTRTRLPPQSEKYYNFTEFACQLNEMEVGVAPTDSRLRSDQRLMEDGRWDESNEEKARLENKQRARRRKTEDLNRKTQDDIAQGKINASATSIIAHQPVWFEQHTEEGCDTSMYIYNGSYWKAKENQDWSNCPDIYI